MIQVSSPVFVLLLFVAVAAMRANSGDNLLRKRREWILPPKLLKENVDYSGQLFIAKIRSDFEANETIRYSLEGIGANQKPFDLFVVNPENGFIRLTQKLDREKIDTYNLSGVATNNKGQVVERNIAIRIKVVDENDNDPEFGVIKSGKVDEHSSAGTSVMKITATDADEPGLENSQIAYSIIAQDPSDDMFYMTDDGTIYVNRPFLDRETVDHYTLSVKGQDLNGKQGGRSGTGTVTINVVDVNDNLPTLEKVEVVFFHCSISTCYNVYGCNIKWFPQGFPEFLVREKEKNTQHIKIKQNQHWNELYYFRLGMARSDIPYWYLVDIGKNDWIGYWKN